MRLTPADVHNVAFKKPSIGKRGYDEDEVDAFLDLVEAELSRLIEENNELALRAGQGAATGAPVAEDTGSVPAPPRVDGVADVPVSMDKAPSPTADVTGPAAHHMQAARLLGLAQETAERLTGDAAAEAEATRSAARAESEALLGEAQAQAGKLLEDAQDRSRTMVDDATSTAETLERESRQRAEALDHEAQAKYSQVMGSLTDERAGLERKIADLRVYEREYRLRLKSWISDQLTHLDEGGTAITDIKDQHVSVGAE